MNHKTYFIASMVLCISIIVSVSCYSTNCITKKAKEKESITYTSLLPNYSYKNGFDVSSTKEGIGTSHGTLNYDGITKGKPFWRIAQWNNYNNDILTAKYSFVNNQHSYLVGKEGNRVAVDIKKDIIILEINTSTEYGKNGITSNPRKNFESWPHLLIEHNWNDDDCLKISNKSRIRMNIDYIILKMMDRMPVGTTDTTLHTAQFKWYITIQNKNALSDDYGRFIWFGLSFYDNRYEYPTFYAAQDGGKEINTNAFIYSPDMKQLLSSQGKPEVGKKMSFNADILPIIKEAFALAQQRNYLTKSKWDDMYIGGTNIGWEVSGTYDVSVQISKLNILYR